MRNSGLRTVKKKEKKTAVGTNLVFCFPKTETVVGTAHEGDVSRRGHASKALSREQQPGSKTSRRAAGGTRTTAAEAGGAPAGGAADGAADGAGGEGPWPDLTFWRDLGSAQYL